MANKIQLRRGVESSRTGIIPDNGEMIIVTDTIRLYAGDGSTAGGVLLAAKDILDGSNVDSLHKHSKLFDTSSLEAEALTVDSAADVGIGTTTPDGRLHIFNDDTTLVPSVDADDFIIEGTGNTGLTFLGSTSSVQQIAFGDVDSNISGQIKYTHGDSISEEALEITVNSSAVLTLTDSQASIIGTIESTSGGFKFPDATVQTTAAGGSSAGWNSTAGQVVLVTSTDKVGIGTSNPQTPLHVLLSGTSGTPGITANTTAVIQASGSSGSDALLTLISGNSATTQLLFGDTDSDIRGRVFYNHTDDSLSFWTANTSQVHIDADGKVGIGTTPSVLLHIKSSSGNSELRIDTSSTDTDARLAFYENAVDKWVLFNDGNDGDKLKLQNNTVPNILVTDQTGNVGIGTGSPGSKLHVSGTGLGNASIKLTNTSGRTFEIGEQSNSHFLEISNSLTDGPITFSYLGYVGLGNGAKTPEAHLHISEDGLSPLTLKEGSGGSPASDSVRVSNGTLASKTIVNSNHTLWYTNFQGYDGGAFRTAASILVEVDGTPGASDMPGRIIFKTTEDGGIVNSERMRIDNAGRVGIGTSNPTQKLSVVAPSAIVDITSSTSTSFNGLELKNGGGSLYVGQDNSTGSFYSTSAYAGVLYHSGAYPIAFCTTGTERMRVDATGNVGIGAGPVTHLTPGLSLHGTAPGIALYDTNGASDEKMFDFYADAGTLYGRAVADSAGSAQNWIQVDRTGTTVDAVVFSNGNVGIGTFSYGGGVNVLGIVDAGTVPSANPTGGHVIYSQAGALKGRGSSGTVTTIAVAEPHCPNCGRDFMLEWDNKEYGYFSVCVPCMVEEFGSRSWIVSGPSRL
jgi:hypothetical protein